MSVVATGAGHFQIPTAPAAGTSVTSGTANNFTTTAIVLSASTSAMYITGVHVESSAALAATYVVVGLMQGGSGSETFIGQYLVPLVTGSTVALGFRDISPPLKVAALTRLSVKTADSVGSKATLITVECILQSNVVDDGIAVGTVTTVTTVTNQLTAAAIATGVWQDAVSGDFTTASSIGKALYIANVAPGASGGHLISGSNAGTTTLGALTVSGATTLTGNVALADGLTVSAPSTTNRAGLDIAGNGTGAALKLTAGATGIGFNVIGGATSGDGIKVTTTSGHGVNLAPVGSGMHGFFSTGGNGGTSDGMKLAAGTGGVDLRANQTGNLVGTVSTLTTYTGNTPQTGDAYARLGAPAGASVSADVAAVKVDTAAVKVQTDKFAFTVANQVDCNVLDWKSAAAPAMTGDAYARLGAPAGASVSADVAAVKVDTAAVKVQTDKLTFTVANQVDCNSKSWAGGAIPAVNVTGVPLVDLKYTLGTISPATAGSVRADAVTGAVGSVAGAVGSVTARVTANTDQWAGGAIPAVNVTGVPLVDLKYTLGTISPATAGTVRADAVTGLTASNLDAAVSSRLATTSYTAPDNAGIALIEGYTDSIESRLPAALVGGRMDASVGSNLDKTGYSLTQGFPDNFAAFAITAGGVVTADLDTSDETKLDELYQIHGLKSGADLAVSATARTAGLIAQTISTSAGTTTVTR